MRHDMIYRSIELERDGIDNDARTVPASLSSEAPVTRLFGTEVLVHEKGAVDMKRAKKGLPLLFSHDREAPIGRVEKIKLTDGKLRGILRFSKNSRATEIWDDVREGLLTDMSIGYRINEYEETDDGIRATDWMPYEASVVSVPADDEVGINRQHEELDMAKRDTEETPSGKDKTTGAGSGDNVTDFLRAQEKANQRGIEAGQKAERERISAVRDIFEPFTSRQGFSELCDACIRDGKTADQARSILLAQLGGEAEPLGSDYTQDFSVNRSLGGKNQTAAEKALEGMSEALEIRADLASDEVKKRAHQNEFTGMTLSELAREWLRITNVRTAGWDKSRIVGAAFMKRDVTETAFDMTVSDFPSLLADVANKALLRGYEEAPESWRMFCSTGQVSDFKTNNRPNMSMFPDLETVAENAQFPLKQVSDWHERITASTKGARFSITRQALVNDDLDSFTRIPRYMGRAAARAVGDDAYRMLLTIQTMNEDSNPLFDAANHNNVYAAEAPSVQSVDAIRVGMGTQTDPSGATLNLRPAVLVCPLTYEGVASTLRNAQFDPDTAEGSGNTGGNRPNWVAGTFEVVADARIDADANATNWFMLADPAMFDGIEVAFLNGVETPFLDQRDGFTIDGTEYKVRLDYGVAPLDWRTIALNGTAPI